MGGVGGLTGDRESPCLSQPPGWERRHTQRRGQASSLKVAQLSVPGKGETRRESSTRGREGRASGGRHPQLDLQRGRGSLGGWEPTLLAASLACAKALRWGLGVSISPAKPVHLSNVEITLDSCSAGLDPGDEYLLASHCTWPGKATASLPGFPGVIQCCSTSVSHSQGIPTPAFLGCPSEPAKGQGSPRKETVEGWHGVGRSQQRALGWAQAEQDVSRGEEGRQVQPSRLSSLKERELSLGLGTLGRAKTLAPSQPHPIPRGLSLRRAVPLVPCWPPENSKVPRGTERVPFGSHQSCSLACHVPGVPRGWVSLQKRTEGEVTPGRHDGQGALQGMAVLPGPPPSPASSRRGLGLTTSA